RVDAREPDERRNRVVRVSPPGRHRPDVRLRDHHDRGRLFWSRAGGGGAGGASPRALARAAWSRDARRPARPPRGSDHPDSRRTGCGTRGAQEPGPLRRSRLLVGGAVARKRRGLCRVLPRVRAARARRGGVPAAGAVLALAAAVAPRRSPHRGDDGWLSVASPPDRVRTSAHAKVNLFLRILAREAGGYHQIETAFALLELADEVTVSRSPGAGD